MFVNCKTVANHSLGRYIVAEEDIRTGDTILLELPVVVLPQWETSVCCSNCYQESMTVCKNCKIFPLCFNCTSHDENDCNFFRDITDLPTNFLIDNFIIFGPLKCLILGEMNEAQFKAIIEMESHQEIRRGSDIWNLHNKLVVEPILKSGLTKMFHKLDVDSELIQKICGIMDVNAFDVRGPDNGILRAIYPKAALLCHDCVANTVITVDSAYNLKIYASIAIKKGEMVTYSYTNSLLGTPERMLQLKIGKYFNCTCKRCLDPTELGTHFSSINCKSCNQALCILINSSNYSCMNCKNTIDVLAVERTIQIAKKEISEADGDIRRLEMLIIKYAEILNPQHYIIFDLKQNIAAILRAICLNQFGQEPGKLVLHRKIQLCKEIISILRQLHPGISRLTGIALYEYYDPLKQLTERMFHESEISKDEYIEKMHEVQATLKEAINMLIYELPNSPEGQLVKRAFVELKQLKEKLSV